MGIEETIQSGATRREIAMWQRIDDAVGGALAAWHEIVDKLPPEERAALRDEE